MARRGRGNRFEICIPIAVCMSRDFGISYQDIGAAFGCARSTVAKNLKANDYKCQKRKSPASGRNPGNVKSNEQSERECRDRFFYLWDEYGYSDKFEFIGGRTSSKGKVKLRCKLCGEEFERFGNLVQQHINTRCPNCWIHLNDETIAPRDYKLAERIVSDYLNGAAVYEIAKYYNLQERPVSKMLHDCGITPDCRRAGKRSKESDKRRKEKEKLKQSRVLVERRIKDELCELTSSVKQMRLLLDVISAESTRLARKTRIDYRKIDEFAIHEPKLVECNECGETFLFWPSWERYGRRVAPMFCSERCSNRHAKRSQRGKDNIRHRLRRYGNEHARRDPITLDKLLERDGNKCYICGCETDKSDHTYSANGYFCCGSKYPTVDHVIPLKRGGLHVWENVKIACHRCNSLKSDKLLSEL